MILVSFISFAYCHGVFVYFWYLWYLIINVSFLTKSYFCITEHVHCASLYFHYIFTAVFIQVFFSKKSLDYMRDNYTEKFKKFNTPTTFKKL